MCGRASCGVCSHQSIIESRPTSAPWDPIRHDVIILDRRQKSRPSRPSRPAFVPQQGGEYIHIYVSECVCHSHILLFPSGTIRLSHVGDGSGDFAGQENPFGDPFGGEFGDEAKAPKVEWSDDDEGMWRVSLLATCLSCIISDVPCGRRVRGVQASYPSVNPIERKCDRCIAPPQPNHPTLRRPSPPCVILRHSAPAPSTLRHLARVTAPHHLALAALPHPAPNRRMRRPSRMSRSLWLLPKPQAMPITCRPIHLNRRCTSAFLPLVTSSPRDCARLQPSPWPAFCVHSYRRANSARAGPFVRHSPARKGGRRCCGSKPGFLSRAEFASCGTCRADNPPGVWLR